MAADVRTARRASAKFAAAVTVSEMAAQSVASNDAYTVDVESADGYFTNSDAPADEKLSDQRAAASPARSALEDAGFAKVTNANQAAASDDKSETSSIFFSVSAVGVGTRRTTRTTSQLQRALDNSSSAIKAAFDAYALIVILSDDIKVNHLTRICPSPPCKLSRRRRPCPGQRHFPGHSSHQRTQGVH